MIKLTRKSRTLTRPRHRSGSHFLGFDVIHPVLVSRVATAAIGALILSLLVPATPASATTVASSALLLRTGDGTSYFQRGAGTTMSVGIGSDSGGGATVSVMAFYASDGTSTTHLEMTDKLAPGTYSANYYPGAAQAVLFGDGATDCAPSETLPATTLTITQAAYDSSGLPTTFAASFIIGACNGVGEIETGVIHWNSTAALTGVEATPYINAYPSPVTVNSHQAEVVHYTAFGTGPITLGKTTLTQTTPYDGTDFYSVAADKCSGVTLSPGQTCAVTLTFAPNQPDGFPAGELDARVHVDDGAAVPSPAFVSSLVQPLPGQVGRPEVVGEYRQLAVAWASPAGLGNGWSSTAPTTYQLWQLHGDGSRTLVASVDNPIGVAVAGSYEVRGLPDGYRGSFEVIAKQGSLTSAPSLPGTGTTSTSEIVAATQEGIVTQQVTSTPAATLSPMFDAIHTNESLAPGYSPTQDLSLARGQGVFAYVQLTNYDTNPSRVMTARTDGSPGNDAYSTNAVQTSWGWDTQPAVSPDGTEVAYRHADTEAGPTTLMLGTTASGSMNGTPVPNTMGLSQPVFVNADELVAVQPTASGTDLVYVSLLDGTVTPIPDSAGLTSPDVNAAGDILALSGTGQNISLVQILSAGASPVPVPGVPVGVIVGPHYSFDGKAITFASMDLNSGMYSDAEVSLSTNTITAFETQTPASAVPPLPFVLLQADGLHRADATAPTVRTTAPTAVSDIGSTASVSWIGSDPSVTGAVTSGVGSFDVRYRKATASTAFGSYVYPASWQGTTAHTESLTASSGVEYCFSVRARDLDGNISGWTSDRCTTTPLDDRSLTTRAQRGRGKTASYFDGTYTKTASAGMKLTRPGVRSAQVGLLTATCATCGKVKVYIGSAYLGELNTHSPSAKFRQVLWLKRTKTHVGTLSLVAASRAPLYIDGVFAQH